MMLTARMMPNAISRKAPLNMSIMLSFFFRGSWAFQIICKQGGLAMHLSRSWGGGEGSGWCPPEEGWPSDRSQSRCS